MAEAGPVSAIVLAGGRGRRMGNRDKGLIEINGKKLIEHVVSRLQAQVAEFVISCNRNADVYGKYGETVGDREAGFAGPLMGILSAADTASHDLCLVVPCDMPALPADLVGRLFSAIGKHEAAVAHDGDRMQPLVMLVRKRLIAEIGPYLAGGNSSVKGWLEERDIVEVDFSDQPEAFVNVNREP